MNAAELPDILLLAYLGDAAMELIVRKYLISIPGMTPQKCNERSLSFVTAVKQAEAARRLNDKFTEDEAQIFKYGKNAKSNSVPRSASLYTYRTATGLEAVFGYNHINGLDSRNEELFTLGFPENDGQ
ncbi:MAG: ribonuclease III domain-containing protein [Oscillospiraceae bacterium]|nr:ribonuclease III domain-containing protein [Oscillospiraceae bacterium]